MKKTIRVIFLIYIFYHLVVIVLMPNPTSLFSRQWGCFIAPYANTIGMNQTWEFFSPDPPTPFYFNYSVHFENLSGEEIEPSIESYFPEWRTQPTNHPNKIRLKTTVRFLALREDSAGNAFALYLCRKYPKATRVIVRSTFEFVPPLEKVKLNDGNYELIPYEGPPIEKACKEEVYYGSPKI